MEAFLVWRKRTPIDNYFFFMHLRHTLAAACVLESNNLKNVLTVSWHKERGTAASLKVPAGNIVFCGPHQ